MKTFRDLFGFGFVPQIVFDSGGDSGGGSGGGGDSRPDEAKALDETDVSVGYGSGQVDPGLASAVGLAPTGGYSGITGPSAYEISEALGGSDRDPTPASVPVVSAVDPEQTTLESLAQERYLSYDPMTVDDFMVDMDPFDVETVQQLADQYYDFGSEPMSVADQVAQYDSDVNLDLRDIGRDLESGKISVADVFSPDLLAPTGSTTKIVSPGGVGPGQTVDFNRLIDAGGTQDYDIYSPPLSDDDMGLPDISVDQALLDPLGFATEDPMYPYNATLAGDDVVGGVGDVVTSASVPDIELPDNKEIIDKVVAGVLTGTPVEGFDIQTSKVGMPRTGIQGVINDILGTFTLFSGLASGDPAKRQEIADMLSIGSGRAVYNSSGELIGAVDNATGEYVGYPSNEGGFVRGDDGQLIKSGVDVPQYPDPFVGGESDDGCPAGYEFDATIGQCVPIVAAEEEPKISLGEVERPVVTTPRPPRPPSEPVEGMTIRAPKQFNVGGPVTPNIDRFLGSLRG